MSRFLQCWEGTFPPGIEALPQNITHGPGPHKFSPMPSGWMKGDDFYAMGVLPGHKIVVRFQSQVSLPEAECTVLRDEALTTKQYAELVQVVLHHRSLRKYRTGDRSGAETLVHKGADLGAFFVPS